MYRVLAVSTLVFMAACANTTEVAPAVVDTPPSQSVVPDAFDLAMNTVDDLIAAGNEQTAIDRLTQLLGDPTLTDEEAASALFKRAQLRYGQGNDLRGALTDLSELNARYPTSLHIEEANQTQMLAETEAELLIEALQSGDLSPTEEFEARFRLGDHQDAVDLILARNLKPDNAYIVDLFQVGYLCDDANLTGPSFDMSEPDGTVRTVRFCEFGK